MHVWHRETQHHVTSATKRPAIALEDDDDDHVTCPSAFNDREQPEVVRRRAPPDVEKNVDDELVSPPGSEFQLMTSSSESPPGLSVYRSAPLPAPPRVFVPPPPSAAAFQLAAFHSLYASHQQQQQQLRHAYHHPPSPHHLRFSLVTDSPSLPGMQRLEQFLLLQVSDRGNTNAQNFNFAIKFFQNENFQPKVSYFLLHTKEQQLVCVEINFHLLVYEFK